MASDRLRQLAAAAKLAAVDWSDQAAAGRQALAILLDMLEISELQATFDIDTETVQLMGKHKGGPAYRQIKFADIEDFLNSLSGIQSGNATPVTAGP